MNGTNKIRHILVFLICLAVFNIETKANASESFIHFESGQVRPLALSHNNMLFAVNTPDNRLEIYKTKNGNLQHIQSVPVGMEPVAVAIRNQHEIWVVNHLSDSISIVKKHQGNYQVVRTLLVGDEPRDIVFAGPGNDRAFITTAHRGQNAPYDPQLTTPGIGRADVWVYDANNLSDTNLNSSPLTIINLFMDTPRSLAVSPDGQTVYAAGFATGNQTTIVSELLPTLLGYPSLLSPGVNFEGIPQPITSQIVKWNGSTWLNADGIPTFLPGLGELVKLTLPDYDVFVIDAMSDPPAVFDGLNGFYSGVGTILYNMTVNPINGKVYVSNTEALNHKRFEGPGNFSGETVRGHHNENRITVLSAGTVNPRHLNKHIDYSTCCNPVPNLEQETSVGLPTSMTVSKNGQVLYVAALGSSEVAIYNTNQLENNTFVPNKDNQIKVSGGGPTGIVLDEKRKQLYVLTRFDNGISIINTQTKKEIKHVKMFNPEPTYVTAGRRFLYDTTLSSKGDSSCATCHVFGDKDEIAWDLGNPDATIATNNNEVNPFDVRIPIGSPHHDFAPLKGPMVTQSLRGLANHGPQHWRGDRTGAYNELNAQPDEGAYDEREAFRQFQAAFEGLIGRPEPISNEDMEKFIDFALEIMYPPNPIRNLDDSLTPDQQVGHDFFFNNVSTAGVAKCADCHITNPEGNAEFGVKYPGFFGTDGRSALEPASQVFKVPHLRNMYTKVGMFGFPGDFLAPLVEEVAGVMGPQGPQIRGFGFNHDGSNDMIARFLSVASFSQGFPFGPNPGGFPIGADGTPLRRQVEEFLFAFPTNLKPIVGQQVTITNNNINTFGSRVLLMMARAEVGDCDLVARAKNRGFLYIGNNEFIGDSAYDNVYILNELFTKPIVTLMCVPPGTGHRIALDRDDDGILDRDDPILN